MRIVETASNFLLSVVRAVEPRDELEAMLAVQMDAINQAKMMARRLNHVDNLAQHDAAERALNKLACTYAMQMKALKRYRTGGQQKVTVEHVTVNAGGRAIVGNVACGGGNEPRRQPDERGECSPQMCGAFQADGKSMQRACSKRVVGL